MMGRVVLAVISIKSSSSSGLGRFAISKTPSIVEGLVGGGEESRPGNRLRILQKKLIIKNNGN